MKFANLKIGARLSLAFGLLVLLFIVNIGISLHSMRGAEQRMNNIIDDRYKKVSLSTEIKYNVAQIHQYMRDALIAGDAGGVNKQSEAIGAVRARNKELLDVFDRIINTVKARELFTRLEEARAKDLQLQGELFGLLSDGKAEEAKALLNGKLAQTERDYVQLLTEMAAFQSGIMDKEAQACKAEFAEARNMLLIIAAIAVAIAIAAAWYATRSITAPMNEAVEVARRVAGGDLMARIEVRSSDETGQMMQALKDMNQSLIGIVSQVRSSTETIVTASGEIAMGNMDLSSRTEQQASSLEETASSMEELTSTVKQNSDNAHQANRLASAASDVAAKGGSAVSEVVDTMGAINDASKKIVDIIGVIDGIAFQTNILALNAAVEAARAGEQGRGFAVVAAEVRTLAQRSAIAAREIKSLIGDSVDKVGAGAKLVDQAGATMREVVASVKHVSDIIGEITSAGQEQTAGIEQINQAIMQMDNVTQQNAALVEQAAAAAQSMQEQAAALSQIVAVFKISEDAIAAARTRTQPAAARKPARELAVSPKTPALVRAPQLARADDDWEEF